MRSLFVRLNNLSQTLPYKPKQSRKPAFRSISMLIRGFKFLSL
jgi:hypothetical protein